MEYIDLNTLWDDVKDQYSKYDCVTGKPTHDKDGNELKGKEWLKVHNKYHAAIYHNSQVIKPKPRPESIYKKEMEYIKKHGFYVYVVCDSKNLADIFIGEIAAIEEFKVTDCELSSLNYEQIISNAWTRLFFVNSNYTSYELYQEEFSVKNYKIIFETMKAKTILSKVFKYHVLLAFGEEDICSELKFSNIVLHNEMTKAELEQILNNL